MAATPEEVDGERETRDVNTWRKPQSLDQCAHAQGSIQSHNATASNRDKHRDPKREQVSIRGLCGGKPRIF